MTAPRTNLLRKGAVRLLALAASLATAVSCGAQSLVLFTNAQVTGDGIFLAQIGQSTAELPHLRVADAPAFGQSVTLTRAQVSLALQAGASTLGTNWTGADRVRVTRRARALSEAELSEQLTGVLQRDFVREKGELELRFTRAWPALAIPDEAYTLKVLDLPGNGVSSSFILRFELLTAREKLGPWQMPVTAKVWRELLVARSPLRREQLLDDADVTRERRDVLMLREAPFTGPEAGAVCELAENVLAGAPLTVRSVRLKPVIHRGQMVEARVTDGPMTISIKVEALENGAPGQLVRIRNPQSRREFKGKVKDEQTILVSL